MTRTDEIVEEQIAFYRADAESYEAWFEDVFHRGGGAAFGGSARRDRERALAELGRLGALGHVLELAAGTGSYTAALLASAEHVTAVDASPEALDLARAKLAAFADRLTLVEANIFRWRPTRRYSTVLCSYWLSHVPTDLFGPFWQLLAGALAPSGQVFLIDSRGAEESPPRVWAAGYRERDDPSRQISTRELNGRQYRVVKVSYEPAHLARRLSELGWQARLVQGESSWWGTVIRRAAAA